LLICRPFKTLWLFPLKMSQIRICWLEFRIVLIFYPFGPGKEDILSNKEQKVPKLISKIDNLVRGDNYWSFSPFAYVFHPPLFLWNNFLGN
jgi:hypothetical protein